MFTAALFTIAKKSKQPKCQSTEEWIKEDVVHIYNGIFLSHKKELMPFAATWMDLEIIILSEVSQRKTIVYDITYMWNLKNSTNELIYKTETDSQT